MDHDDPLYFKGMVAIAACWVVWAAIFFIAGGFLIFSNPIAALLFIGIGGVGSLGFGAVKMYLHIRKDNLEIMEMMQNV